jgi:hypothetical protein
VAYQPIQVRHGFHRKDAPPRATRNTWNDRPATSSDDKPVIGKFCTLERDDPPPVIYSDNRPVENPLYRHPPVIVLTAQEELCAPNMARQEMPEDAG